MRRQFVFGGIGFLAACLAGWAALASAQSVPSGGTQPVSAPPPGPFVGRAPDSPLPPPLGVMPLKPSPAVPLLPPSAAEPAALPPAVPPAVPQPTPPRFTPPEPALPGVPLPASENPPPATPAPPPAAEAVPSRSFKPAEAPDAEDEKLIGRQEPSVSIEWAGNAAAKIGQPSDYSLVVRNVSSNPVQQVKVRVKLPGTLSLVSCEPRAASDGGVRAWDLGELAPRQERVILLKVKAESRGDVVPKAWVTFTGAAAMRIRVREPKLALKCTAPDKVLVGDPAAFTLTVSNPGDGAADQIKIRALLSEGLEHARGNKIDFDIGSLAAGESRNVTLLCATRLGGTQKCEASVEAEGGVSARDSAALNVIVPRLDLQLTGPRLRYLDRRAIYSLKVTNPGDAPATNVTAAHVVPAGFKVLAASDGGRHDYQTRTVSWFLGEIPPGGASREVRLEVQAVQAGDYKHRATVVGARGLRAEAELTCRTEGLSALLVELVDLDDPIEAGADTGYEVRITNSGSKTEEDVKLVVTVPDRMQFKNAQGPARYKLDGKTVVFEPVARLAPRAEVVFRLNVKALEAGTALVKIGVTSVNLADGVVKTESTRIYSDTMATGTSRPAAPKDVAVPPKEAPISPKEPAAPAPGTVAPVPEPAPRAPAPEVPGASAPPAAGPALPAPNPVVPVPQPNDE